MSSVPETSTSLVFEAFNQPLNLKKSPVPTNTSTGTAIIRILSTTIRPHNRAAFNGAKVLPFPVPYQPGNSAVARILSTGPDAVSLKAGQLVWVNGFITARDDPEGTACLLGLTDAGTDKTEILFNAWPGMWADVASAPLESCVPLNEDILCGELGYSFGDLEYIERLAVAAGGTRAANLQAGETVVVSPATGHYSGAVAELAAQIGCRVIALTRTASKLKPLTTRYPRITALEVTGDAEVDTAAILALLPKGSNGVDAFIDISPFAAAGSPEILNAGLNALRPHGRAILMGALLDVKINHMNLMFRNISVKGQWMYTRAWLVDLIHAIEGGVVQLGREAGHEIVNGGFGLEDWETAIQVAEEAVQWGRQTLFLP